MMPLPEGWLLLPAILALPFGARHWLRRRLTPARRTDGATPATLGLAARALRLPGGNGKRLFAWLLPAPGHQRAPLVILQHGWGGNASDLLTLAGSLQAAGHAVLLPEARGHGRSDGDTFSSLPRFAEDLEAALDWARRQPAIDPRRIALAGHSVGGAAALLVAARRPDVAAVVGIAAFAHPETVMRRFLAAHRIPFRPFGWLVLRYVERVIGHRFPAIAPERAIARIPCPVLLIHGRDDTTVPLADARRLCAASAGKARLIELPGGHEGFDPASAETHEALASLRAFLDAPPAAGTPP